MTCSFSKELSAVQITSVENSFILEYLPLLDGNTVKTYLYGLFLCQNKEFDIPLSEIAKNLSLTEEETKECFNILQEYDLVSVVNEPFSVMYQPIAKGFAKAKKYKPEKYTEFCACLQQLFPSRAIGITEFTEYFNIMEIYSIKQEAMLMIVRYCIERKGESIGYRYISKVAKDFGSRGLTTIEKVDAEISKYVSRTAELEKILKSLGSTKQPDIEHLKFLNKWTNELGFNLESIIFSASNLKKGSFEKLDSFLMELYSLKCFTIEEIERHATKKKELFNVSVKIAKELSQYFEVIDTVVDNYTSKWFDYGYGEKALLFIAHYCFKQGKNTLDNMDKIIEFLFKNGLIAMEEVSNYFLKREQDDEFISSLIEILGLKRSVTAWDRDNLKNWRDWNFSDEMITEAFKKAVGKSSPIPYVNAVLGSWKNKNIYTITDIEKDETVNKQPTNGRPTGITVEKVSAKYEEYRYMANEVAQNNVKKAEKLDGFTELMAKVNSLEIDLAMAEFGQNRDKINAIESEYNENKAKLTAMLKKVDLTLDDLKPKFRCSICNDTGFDGVSKCRCYDEVVNELKKQL